MIRKKNWWKLENINFRTSSLDLDVHVHTAKWKGEMTERYCIGLSSKCPSVSRSVFPTWRTEKVCFLALSLLPTCPSMLRVGTRKQFCLCQFSWLIHFLLDVSLHTDLGTLCSRRITRHGPKCLVGGNWDYTLRALTRQRSAPLAGVCGPWVVPTWCNFDASRLSPFLRLLVSS